MNLLCHLTFTFYPLRGCMAPVVVVKPSPLRQRWAQKSWCGAQEPSVTPAQLPSSGSHCLHGENLPER